MRLRENLPDRKPQLWEHPVLNVQRRLKRAVFSRVDSQWPTRPQRVKLAEGDLWMDVVPRAYVDNGIFDSGIHEAATTHTVLAYLQPGMTFVDVGANIGYFSLLAAARVGPEGAVHAFEPVAANRARLEEHARTNQLTNIHVRSEAAWSQTGTMPLYESGWGLNHGLASCKPRAFNSAVASEVPSIKLDDAAKQFGRAIDLIKIDVEGGEQGVLDGAAEILQDPNGPAILFEGSDTAGPLATLERHGYTARVVAYELTGLRFYSLDDPAFVPCPYELPNLLAVKKVGAQARYDALTRATGTYAKIRKLFGRR